MGLVSKRILSLCLKIKSSRLCERTFLHVSYGIQLQSIVLLKPFITHLFTRRYPLLKLLLDFLNPLSRPITTSSPQFFGIFKTFTCRRQEGHSNAYYILQFCLLLSGLVLLFLHQDRFSASSPHGPHLHYISISGQDLQNLFFNKEGF